MKSAIDEAWRRLNDSKPAPEIFWAFIENERNNILKEYSPSATRVAVALTGGIEFALSPVHVHRLRQEGRIVGQFFLMREGAFKGRDQRAVAREAIDWWNTYLDEIDAQVALSKKSEG